MFSDDPLILELLALMKAYGVCHIVIAPDSRHYPLVKSLEHDKDFTLYSVIDERSAGFFALGLIQAIGSPVATLCASGPGAINFGSAVVEAYYQKLPLCVITPDRLPKKMENHVSPQTNLFRDFTRHVVLLKPILNELDRGFVNRVLNEALDALTADGGGPVQINLPSLNSAESDFRTAELPKSRAIQWHRRIPTEPDWATIARRLQGKRIQLIWGQNSPLSVDLLTALDAFTQAFDVLTLADHLSNLDHDSRVRLPLLYLQLPEAQSSSMQPDIVISVFGNLMFQDAVDDLFRGSAIEHWRVAEDGETADPFRRLTDLFQMSPEHFFRETAKTASDAAPEHRYRHAAFELYERLPQIPDGETAVINHFLARLPKNSVLHIGNGTPLHMAQFYDIDPSVLVFANRGADGIDGSMSAAVGYAASSTRLNFLIIGSHSFFHDMNALWIRHRSLNLRIIILNTKVEETRHTHLEVSPQIDKSASTAHHTSVRGWVESLGIHYTSAENLDELNSALAPFTDAETNQAMALEIFTETTSETLKMNGKKG